MSFANLTDVADRLGRPIADPDEIKQVNAWIGDVEAIIRSRIPDLDERIAAGPPTVEIVAMVTTNAVVRKALNPTGKQNERIDDYSYGLTEDAARGDLFLTESEWGMLLPHAGAGGFSTRPGFEPDRRALWPRR
ncbi:Gp19/Gp15/Gp42 family protein [Pseudactinotalea sp. Z1748]|uniref:Gp19/Gp15/Gp42 family protein n=1 Tax=Pseudactinotalea sp. Z1748 TaxID=3413027 RepID=UPI003C7BD6E1